MIDATVTRRRTEEIKRNLEEASSITKNVEYDIARTIDIISQEGQFTCTYECLSETQAKVAAQHLRKYNYIVQVNRQYLKISW